MEDWHINQKVICIDDSFSKERPFYKKENFPRKDRIYTIRDIFLEKDVCLVFQEIVNKPRNYTIFSGGFRYCELRFFSKRFRPLDEEEILSKIDISIFQKILEKIPELV